MSPGGSWGYPALALRSLVYANPWVSSYAFEKETELSMTWHTFISRLIPHRSKEIGPSILTDCEQDLKNNFVPGKWKQWLRTPVSAGGGGTIEFSDMSVWTRIDHKQKIW